MFSYKVSK
jgi:hypothetical protein